MMKIKFSKVLVIILMCFVLPNISQAQQSTATLDPDRSFREAVDLFEKGLYGAAREQFRLILESGLHPQSARFVDATYYDAVCAIESGDDDASEKVKNFADTYRSSRWMSRITLLQARVYFKENNFQQALNAFRQVSPSSLTRAERNEYFFKTGFAQFRTNDNDRALVNFAKVKDEKSVYQNPAVYYYAHIQYLKGNYDDALKHFNRIENDRAFSKTIPVYVLQIHYHKGAFDKVIESGERVMNTADKKHRAEIARMIAEAYYRKNDYARAYDYYQIFEQTGRKQLSRDDHYQIGFTKYKTGRIKESIHNFQQAIGKDDALTQNAYYYLGKAYFETKQAGFARNAFLSAYKSKADPAVSEDALFNYVRLSIEAGADPYNQAVQALESFLAANPASDRRNEASSYIVQLYLNSRNYQAALESLEKVRPRSRELQAIYQQLTYSRGIELFNRADFSQAAEYFEKSVNEKSDAQLTARATFWLADSYYRQKKYDQSRKYFREFLASREASKLDIFPLASYNIGYTFFNQKQYQEALPSFRQFTGQPYSRQPKLTYDAWLRIGDIHFISRQYTEAANAYDQVVKARQPESDYALFQKAQCYGALGNFNLKIATLEELVKNHQRSSYYDNALYEMGTTSLVMNDTRSAIAQFDKLVREKPRSQFAKEALMKTGLIYYNNNQNDRAITSLKKVVEDYPGTSEAREALNTLKAIYMEMNKLQDFFAYAEKSGAVRFTGSEQDSLAFVMAENFYLEGRYPDAASALDAYLVKFPNGANILTANYYRARIALRDKQPDKALQAFGYIINFQDNQYTDEALLESARILYDREDYARAGSYYNRLYNQTDEPMRQLEALEGKMKSNYFLKRYDDAVKEARMLKSSERAGQEQQLQASYILGKSLFEQRTYSEATVELSSVIQRTKNVLGAEAAYLLALISYELGQYDEAENKVFSLADNYAAHEFWVARGFILLADVYVKKDNVFQAKQTLQSIIDNYKGDDLRSEAIRKLNQLK
jgi:TolA-binding protein